MSETKEVIVFKCRKCENLICTDENNVHKIITLDCPHCGEEAEENWILLKQDYWQEESEG